MNDFHIITSNYQELVGDENPILYTGTNSSSNRILGIIVEESDDDYSIRYFHVVISDDTFMKFKNKKISLFEILKSSDFIFVLDKFGDDIISSNVILFDEIPEDYLPAIDSFCPDINSMATLEYGVSLQGKTSDLHLVEVPEANAIQTMFQNILYHILHSLSEFNLKPRCYLQPAIRGSFKVNYKIQFENSNSDIKEKDQELIASYIRDYLNFLVSNLQNDTEQSLKDGEVAYSESFEHLSTKFYDIFKALSVYTDSDSIEKELSESLNRAALRFENVSEQIKNSSSFSSIEIFNCSNAKTDDALGIIDENFFEKIKPKLSSRILSETRVDIDEDNELKPYRIWVYGLNTQTGNASARLYPEVGEHFIKVSVKIDRAGKNIDNSIYSKSLDEKKVIEIMGIAKKVNGIVKTIFVKL